MPKILREYVIVEPVETLGALTALDVSTYSGAAISCFVRDVKATYMLDRTSTQTSDGVNVITPAVGAGRWFRIVSRLEDFSVVGNGGVADTYTATFDERLTAYEDGQRVYFKADVVNTGASTLNIDGVGAKKIIHPDGSDVSAGEIPLDTYVHLIYNSDADSGNGAFEIVTQPLLRSQQYYTATATDVLSAEKNLGALTSGLLKHTVAAGVSTPATAVAGPSGDYEVPGENVYYVGPNRLYTTIQAALNAIGNATVAADNITPQTVFVDGGVYDEDLTIPQGRLTTLVAMGTVVLGDGLGANWSSTNTRNITFNVEGAYEFAANAPRPALCMMTLGDTETTSTFVAQASQWFVSGGLLITTGATSHTVVLKSCKFGQGITKAAAGLTNLLTYKCYFQAPISMATATIYERAECCEFDGLVTVDSINSMHMCDIDAGVTVAAVGSAMPPSGFFHCDMRGTFTGPANSIRLDATSNYFFVANGASLAGGATKVFLEELPAANVTYDNGTSGLAATTAQAAIDELAVGSHAPIDAEYWVSTSNGTLTNEVNLGALTTGLVKNTVAAGVGTPSTAVHNTDYFAPGSEMDLAGQNVININYAEFNPIAAPAHAEGLMFYDTANKAPAFYNDETDITLQIGQEFWVRVRNESGGVITNGTPVYISGIQVGGEERPLIAAAQANASATSRAIGVVTHDIGNNEYGFVTRYGTVSDLNTSAFSVGDLLWLSETVAGTFTNTEPQAPNFSVSMGQVLVSDAALGKILVFTQSFRDEAAGSASQLVVRARKDSVGTISAGRPVYITGYNAGADVILVEEADAATSATMPALGLTATSLTNTATSNVVISGRVAGLDTSAFSVGDELFVQTPAGALATTKPASNYLIQKMGTVLRSNVANGVIQVNGAGRVNDVPNFTAADKYWYGGASGVVTEGDITSFARTLLDDADAATARTTLGALTSTLADTNIFVGNGSNVATGVAMSGDATIANTGAVTIANNAITTAKINDDAVTLGKMAAGTAGNLISYDALGDPTAVGTGTAGQLLKSNGAGLAPSFQDAGFASSTLADSNIYVGNGTNVATAVAVSGDMNIANTGAMTAQPAIITGKTEVVAALGDSVLFSDVDDAGNLKRDTIDGLLDLYAAKTATFTNKTFDANGTGNSISNIDVADLANGTDGELITWDAAGAPTTVAVGTAGQVLTSNGAGAAPTFQDPTGGTGRAISQAAHGFTVGAITPVRYNGTIWVGAQADSAANGETQYIAVASDGNNFTLYSAGDYITGHNALTANTLYFLDAGSAGAITATEPSTAGNISKPIFETITTTTGYVVGYRGKIVQ